MDRRIAMVGLVSAFVAASCTSAASPHPSSVAEAPTTAPSGTAAPSGMPSPFEGWAPAEVVTLGAPSAVTLGDFFPQRLEAIADRYLLIGQDGQGSSFLIEGSAAGGVWSRLDIAPLGGWIGDVAGGPLGAVLSTDDQATGRVRLWYSRDGLTWGEVSDPPGLEMSSAEHLTAGPGGFAMTADLAASGSESGSDTAAAWTSTDGHTWVDAPSLKNVGVATIYPLVGAFVATASADGAVILELSTDGRTFHPDPAAATSPLRDQVVESPVAGGLLVLERPASGLRAWLGTPSADASSMTWTPAGGDAFVGREAVTGASRGSGVEVLGYDRLASTPIFWSSGDGQTFTEADLGPSTFAGGVSSLVAASGDGIASLGWQADAAGRVVRAMWVSPDGATWSPVATDLFGTFGSLPSATACPAAPTTAEALLRLDPIQWPTCYGDHSITVTGYVSDCGGCGGTTPYIASPSWLIDAVGFHAFWLAPSIAPADAGPLGLGVQIDPSHPVAVPPVRSHVRLVGHFDDAASATCRVLPIAGSGGQLMPPAIAITQCREAFVATSVTILK